MCITGTWTGTFGQKLDDEIHTECPIFKTSKFNVVDSLVQKLGSFYKGR